MKWLLCLILWPGLLGAVSMAKFNRLLQGYTPDKQKDLVLLYDGIKGTVDRRLAAEAIKKNLGITIEELRKRVELANELKEAFQGYQESLGVTQAHLRVLEELIKDARQMSGPLEVNLTTHLAALKEAQQKGVTIKNRFDELLPESQQKGLRQVKLQITVEKKKVDELIKEVDLLIQQYRRLSTGAQESSQLHLLLQGFQQKVDELVERVRTYVNRLKQQETVPELSEQYIAFNAEVKELSAQLKAFIEQVQQSSLSIDQEKKITEKASQLQGMLQSAPIGKISAQIQITNFQKRRAV